MVRGEGEGLGVSASVYLSTHSAPDSFPDRIEIRCPDTDGSSPSGKPSYPQ
jgi:hypothetical protein